MFLRLAALSLLPAVVLANNIFTIADLAVERDNVKVLNGWAIDCQSVGQNSKVTFKVRVDSPLFSTYNVDLTSNLFGENIEAEGLVTAFSASVSTSNTFNNLAVGETHELEAFFSTESIGSFQTEFIASFQADNGGWINTKQFSSGKAHLLASDDACQYELAEEEDEEEEVAEEENEEEEGEEENDEDRTISATEATSSTALLSLGGLATTVVALVL